jgi:hypothetical protein
MARATAVLAVSVAVLAGCGDAFPPWSAPEPTDRLAVRLTSAGFYEGVLVPCGPAPVTRMELLMPRRGEDHAVSPRAWQVDFAPPLDGVRAFEVGGVVPGGVVRVPFRGLGAPGPDRGLLLQVLLADGTMWSESVVDGEKLAGGRVRFRARTTSAEEFAERSRCP